MGIVLKSKMKVLGKLILAFIGCLVFQVAIHRWMLSLIQTNEDGIFYFLLLLRPISSILIGKWIFKKFKHILPTGIATICFKMTFGYLMFAMPVLWSIEAIFILLR